MTDLCAKLALLENVDRVTSPTPLANSRMLLVSPGTAPGTWDVRYLQGNMSFSASETRTNHSEEGRSW